MSALPQRRPSFLIYGLSAALLVITGLFLTQLDLDIPALRQLSVKGHFQSPVDIEDGDVICPEVTCPEQSMEALSKEFRRLRTNEEHGFPDGEEDRGRHGFDWVTTENMFVFGDSFTTNWWKIREHGLGGGLQDYYRQLSSLETNMLDFTWADWLWAMFSDHSKMNYYNIAKAGATVSREVLQPGIEEWGTFEDQIMDFEEFFVNPEAPGPSWDPGSTIFMIFFGINDISQLDRMPAEVLPIEGTMASSASHLVSLSQKLHTLGARNFLFLNAPPFYRHPKYALPGGLGHDIQPRVVESVGYFNSYLDSEVAEFKRENTDSTVLRFDLFGMLNVVLDYPEAFGMTDVERYVMMVGNETQDHGKMGLAFRDFQHPSWSMHNLIARAINGFLLRESWSCQGSNATEEALYA